MSMRVADLDAVKRFLVETPHNEIERQRLEAYLVICEGNVAWVARRLGVTNGTVYRQAVRFGLDIPQARQRVTRPQPRPVGLAAKDTLGRAQLLGALEATEWVLARTARYLRVSRVTVYKRMRGYGIERRRLLKSRRAA